MGLAHWTRIRIVDKSWIRIHIETNADLQHYIGAKGSLAFLSVNFLGMATKGEPVV